VRRAITARSTEGSALRKAATIEPPHPQLAQPTAHRSTLLVAGIIGFLVVGIAVLIVVACVAALCCPTRLPNWIAWTVAGMGVACVSSQERASASWTACVAHVVVSPSGEVKVKKLTVATDVGTQVHPDNIRAQVEGAALWGLSLAMYEKATLKDGGIEQTNFDSYTPLRMSQLPEVAVNVIANGEKATGVGEPAVTVIAPALANAIFNAVGVRVRSLPITPEKIKSGMKA